MPSYCRPPFNAAIHLYRLGGTRTGLRFGPIHPSPPGNQIVAVIVRRASSKPDDAAKRYMGKRHKPSPREPQRLDRRQLVLMRRDPVPGWRSKPLKELRLASRP
jgi:hypothetical protein